MKNIFFTCFGVFLYAITFATACMAADTPASPITITHSTANPSFSLPLRCTYGVDCWVMNTPDIGDENDGKAIDSLCNSRTYDGHMGTDFAIPDKSTMDKGVDVLAAAAGIVLRVRDGEEDRFPTKADMGKTKAEKKECGNGVLINLGNNKTDQWQTIYCHMKKGSIVVKPGQSIQTGDKIGQVGLSGMTEFPHVHIGISHNGKTIDPFTGADVSKPCDSNQNAKPLWNPKSAIVYEPLRIGTSGFSDTPPTLQQLNISNTPKNTLPSQSKAMVFYTTLWGAKERDDIVISIKDPLGNVFAENKITQDKERARQLYFVGRKLPNMGVFKEGEYTGLVNITRKNKDGKNQLFTKNFSLTVQ